MLKLIPETTVVSICVLDLADHKAVAEAEVEVEVEVQMEDPAAVSPLAEGVTLAELRSLESVYALLDPEIEAKLSSLDELKLEVERTTVVKVCVLVLKLEAATQDVSGIPVKVTLLKGAVLSSTGEAEAPVPEIVVEQLVVVVVVRISVADPRRSKKARKSGSTAVRAIVGLYPREMMAGEVML